MFNIYTYEKKLKEEDLLAKRINKEKKILEERKSKNFNNPCKFMSFSSII